MYCFEVGCYNDAHRVVMRNGTERFVCDDCFKSRKISRSNKVTVEFCMWLQDTQVFDMFVNHLNKGLKIETLDINKPLAKKAKGGI